MCKLRLSTPFDCDWRKQKKKREKLHSMKTKWYSSHRRLCWICVCVCKHFNTWNRRMRNDVRDTEAMIFVSSLSRYFSCFKRFCLSIVCARMCTRQPWVKMRFVCISSRTFAKTPHKRPTPKSTQTSKYESDEGKARNNSPKSINFLFTIFVSLNCAIGWSINDRFSWLNKEGQRRWQPRRLTNERK